MNYKFRENTVEITNKDNVILANKSNGYFIRITKEVYEILKIMIENKLSVEQLLSKLNDNEDREYINELINKLIENKVIKKSSEEYENIQNKIASFEMTHRCNLNCVHCCIDADGIVSDKKDLTTTEAKAILDKIVDWNPEIIMLSGGEPMLRKDFIELITYLRKSYSDKIVLATNGTLINDDNAKILAECVDKIDISLDGVDEETCSIVRGKGVFHKVIKNIKKLQNAGFKSITISMAISDKNQHLEEEFKKLNKLLGTQPLIRLFAPVGRGKENKSIFSDKSDDEIYIPEDYYSDDFEKIDMRTCSAGNRELFISYSGDLYPCPQFIDDKYKLGNIKQVKKISELSDKNYNIILKLKSSRNYKECEKCKVNLFCWTCPGELQDLKDNDKAIKYRCNKLKPVLYKRIWGEEI